MNRYQLAIFDLDGTILDTLEDLADALNEGLTAFGYPPVTLAQARARIGNGIRRMVELSVPETCPDQEIDAIRDRLAEYYHQHCCDKTRPYPGILEAFRLLRERGVKTAVVSNKIDPVVQILCDTFFPDLLDYSAGEKTGIRKKPEPDMVRNALEALHADAAETVYVGDSDVDIRTAGNAGLPSVIVTWGFRDKPYLLEQGAERIADTVDEMLELILGEDEGAALFHAPAYLPNDSGSCYNET